MKFPLGVFWLLVPLFIFLFSCSADNPRPIKVREDVCEYCKMVIVDERFAAEVITKKGKVYKFDAIECMVAYYNLHQDEIKGAYVVNFLNPKEFLKAQSAYYVRSQKLRSPMGMNLSAYRSEVEARRSLPGEEGVVLDWTKIRELTGREFKFTH